VLTLSNGLQLKVNSIRNTNKSLFMIFYVNLLLTRIYCVNIMLSKSDLISFKIILIT